MKKYTKTQKDWEIGLASMSGRSDYCKHLFAELSRSSLGQTPYKYAKILWSLHCLPVQYRCFSFKILFCVHRAFHGFALQYISDLLTVYNPVRPLRSSGGDPLLLESDPSVLKVLSATVVLFFGTSCLLTWDQLHLCRHSKTNSKPLCSHRLTLNSWVCILSFILPFHCLKAL